ncbi:MAG: hypothetical protein DMG49_25020 [Acidobacteria bacterium]|nr:MAG: hypothetical protein DMG49_25020 [Acidobacteriota bacterium]
MLIQEKWLPSWRRKVFRGVHTALRRRQLGWLLRRTLRRSKRRPQRGSGTRKNTATNQIASFHENSSAPSRRFRQAARSRVNLRKRCGFAIGRTNFAFLSTGKVYTKGNRKLDG